MEGFGCRGHWVCLKGVSVGTCCADGTYYVEGMGCMRGRACKQACPPDGGAIITRECVLFVRCTFTIEMQVLHCVCEAH